VSPVTSARILEMLMLVLVLVLAPAPFNRQVP
jgi:hypothetical protein